MLTQEKALEVLQTFNDYSNFLPGCTKSNFNFKRIIEIGRLEFNILAAKISYIESENIIR